MADYYGVRKLNESSTTLIATCWMYAQYCECDRPGRPMLWRIGYGLQRLFAARSWPHTVVNERCRYSPDAGDRASFSDYSGAISRSHLVILTFCYQPAAKQGLAVAKRRADKCFSAVGIGYVTAANGKTLLICQDGLAPGQASPANVDKVSPAKAGLATKGAVWNQPGTGLYKWDGSYSNLVMVFVGTPAR